MNIVNQNENFESLIKKLNKTSIKLIIVLNDKKEVIGTVTDGDIRRAFLKRRKKTIANVMNNKPFILHKNNLKNKINPKIRKRFSFAPLVDNNGSFVKIINLEKIYKIENISALVLAGGKGKRLMPLTKKIPKPLIKIKNKTLLEDIINKLFKHKINNISISVNYLAKKIITDLKNKYPNNNINFIKETKYLGTAGSINLVPNIKKNLLVINGDIYTDINYSKLLTYHSNSKSDITICIKEKEEKIQYGVINIKKNKFSSIDEKPIRKYFFNAGIYVIRSSIVNLIKKNEKIDIDTLIKRAIEKKFTIKLFYVFEKWKDIGTKKDLLEINKNYKSYFSK
jgi:dTDP-glucose pyrophosphorylase